MSIVVSALLFAMPPQTTAAERADKFALDLSGTDTPAAPAEPKPPEPAAADASPVAAPALPVASAPATTHFSLDTPIADLIADPGAKAVLDRDMPGLSSDENLPKFRALSLRKLAPLSGGQMSAELMDKLAFDLAALGGGAPPPAPKKRSGPSSGR